MSWPLSQLLLDFFLITAASGAIHVAWFKEDGPLEPIREYLSPLQLAEKGRFVWLRQKIGQAASCTLCAMYDFATLLALLLFISRLVAYGSSLREFPLLLVLYLAIGLSAGRFSMLVWKRLEQ